MQFEPSFFQEEMRSGCLVTEKTKRIWAVELRMLEKFDEMCKKHNLTYYAYYGTLLGAVRHQGFVPWDNDIDLVMFRDDYEKFQTIAPTEFLEPYFYQNSYTDEMIMPFSKVRDSRTSAIEFPHSNINQGIFIDIFPLDDVPDGTDTILPAILETQKLLWKAIANPQELLLNHQQSKSSLLTIDTLTKLSKISPRQRFREFEAFNLSHFGRSKAVNFLAREMFPGHALGVKKEWFQSIEYLPFENMRLPVPYKYDSILTHIYGDYHQFIQNGSCHDTMAVNPDIPYEVVLQKYRQTLS